MSVRPWGQGDVPRHLAKQGFAGFLSGCSLYVLRYPRWGSVQYIGKGTVVPSPQYGVTVDSVRKEMYEVLKRQPRKGAEGESGLPMDPGEFGTLYPCLWDHLTQERWDDGTARKTSSVTVFTDGGVVKCVLKDRDMGVCLWVASSGMDGLFVTLETALNDPTAVWRVDRAEGGTAKRVAKPTR